MKRCHLLIAAISTIRIRYICALKERYMKKVKRCQGRSQSMFSFSLSIIKFKQNFRHRRSWYFVLRWRAHLHTSIMSSIWLLHYIYVPFAGDTHSCTSASVTLWSVLSPHSVCLRKKQGRGKLYCFTHFLLGADQLHNASSPIISTCAAESICIQHWKLIVLQLFLHMKFGPEDHIWMNKCINGLKRAPCYECGHFEKICFKAIKTHRVNVLNKNFAK